jgi:hypothetical protein
MITPKPPLLGLEILNRSRLTKINTDSHSKINNHTQGGLNTRSSNA